MILNYSIGMKLALEQAKLAQQRNEVPVGAVVMLGNEVIGKGYNSVLSLKDPTAHAEMIAITAAAQYLKSEFLENCILYTTLEPCPMCAGAILLARIHKVVFATMDSKFGAGGSIYNILQDGKLNHKVEVIQGIEELASKQLLQTFFQKLRMKKQS
ncbi:MAG: nucleoside deaminase [bacterium]|nr:nucleoside deaminase [bacterium]